MTTANAPEVPAWWQKVISWTLSLSEEERITAMAAMVNWVESRGEKPRFLDQLPAEYPVAFADYVALAREDGGTEQPK